MSNTIRKPRKHPRVRSVNFRTLGWLIRREAAAMILRGFQVCRCHAWTRPGLAHLRSDRIAQRVARLLKKFPQRRYYP